jgi:hypothetical protein
MVDLAAQRHKIETLNPTDHHVFATLTGALLRVFHHLEQVDGELKLHGERLRKVEQAAAPIGADEGPKIRPSTARKFRRTRIPLWNLAIGSDQT